MNIDEKTENIFKEKIYDTSINRIGALLKIIENAIDINKFRNYVKDKNDINKFSRYLKSYEFFICFCLIELIDLIYENPYFLDFKEDRLFKRAIDRVIPYSIFPDDTELCKIALNIFGLIDSSFKSKNSLELMNVLSNIKSYILNPFRETFTSYLKPSIKYKDLNINTLLSRLARSYFHMVFHDGKRISIAYEHILEKGKEFRAELEPDYFKKLRENSSTTIIKEVELPDIFNHLKINRTGNLREKLGDQLFFEGYKQIIDFLWNELFGYPFLKYKILNEIVLSKDWAEFDKYFEKINEQIIAPLEDREEAIDPFRKKVFSYSSEISSEKLNPIKEKVVFRPKKYVKEDDLTNKEKLDKKFLWYDVRTVCSMLSIPCSNHFILMLTGIMNQNKDSIEVIKFIHPRSYGNNYSYAILVEGPIFSYLGDYASWYVFLDFATDHSGTGGLARLRVDEHINIFESKIHLTKFSIDSKTLREYVKDREIKEVNTKIKILEDHLADAKGIILELLYAHFLSKLGLNVIWSIKEKFTNNTEIDLIAFKKFRKIILVYVIELTTTEKNLCKEVKEKVEILMKNSSDLLKFLNLKENFSLKFKGIAISNTKTNLQSNKEVKVINFKDIIKNFRIRVEMKKKLLKIIEA